MLHKLIKQNKKKGFLQPFSSQALFTGSAGHILLGILNHLFNHVAANSAGFPGCDIAIVTLLQIYAKLAGSFIFHLVQLVFRRIVACQFCHLLFDVNTILSMQMKYTHAIKYCIVNTALRMKNNTRINMVNKNNEQIIKMSNKIPAEARK